MTEHWKTVKTIKTDPDSFFPCDKCEKGSLVHPNYIEAGIKMCGYCYDKQEISQNMMKLRNWKMQKMEGNKIFFICDNGHIATISYPSLRKGSSCRKCINESQKSPPKVKYTRPKCECNNGRGGKPQVCPHYNHQVCPIGGSKEWDHKNNGDIKPVDISPQTHSKYWYICLNDWCQMTYASSPHDRVGGGMRCPYCVGQKVCHWNCFSTNYPELCKDWDPNNIITPDQITPGSDTKVNWLCHKHKVTISDLPFIYTTSVRHRAKNGSGCPRCNRLGGDQIHLGHSQFVQDAIAIHGNKYKYNDKYQGIFIPIEIYCPVLNSHSIPHGNFKITPHAHKQNRGCPICTKNENESKLVKKVQLILDSIGFHVGQRCIREQSFDGLNHQKTLRVDRYIPELNLVIEIDGGYHFKITSRGLKILEKCQTRDLIKDKYCVENKINILRIPYNFGPIAELLIAIIGKCREGLHVYASYNHYYRVIASRVDVNNILCVDIPSPRVDNLQG